MECPATFLKTDSITNAFLKILLEFPSVFYKFRAAFLEHKPTTASVNCCANHKYLNYKLPINYTVHCILNYNRKHSCQVFLQTIVDPSEMV